MSDTFYPGQKDYIAKLNTLALAGDITAGVSSVVGFATAASASATTSSNAATQSGISATTSSTAAASALDSKNTIDSTILNLANNLIQTQAIVAEYHAFN